MDFDVDYEMTIPEAAPVVSKIPSILTHAWEDIPFPECVDNSMLSTLKACEMKNYLSYQENLSPRGTSVHLHAGGAFAHGIENTRRAFYIDGKSVSESISLGATALLEYYGDFECPAESSKSAERMAGALVFYFDNYPLGSDYIKPWTDGTSHGIEFSFAFPLDVLHPTTGQPLIYVGRFDMLGQHRDGPLLVVDEKTASQLGATWSKQWDLDSQFTGYCYGARLYGRPVVGALIRGISILKTKYGAAEAIVYREKWETDRWLKITNKLAQRMVDIWKNQDAMPQLDKAACGAYGGCAFNILCKSEHPEKWKAVNFEPRVWHPMLREEREEELAMAKIAGMK